MKIDVSTTFTQTKNLGDFENIKPSATITVRDIETEDLNTEEVQKLWNQLWEECRKQVEGQLQQGPLKTAKSKD